jgi:hypothetical protein
LVGVPGGVVNVGGVSPVSFIGERTQALVPHDFGHGGDGTQGRAKFVGEAGEIQGWC